MFICRFALLGVVTVLCIFLCVGSSHAEPEKQALLKLKDGFIHGRHILSSWNGEDFCKWKGVSCDDLPAGHVTRLDLPFSNDLDQPPMLIFNSAQLGGKIDSSICELQYLTYLDLSYNHLEGEIPKCIGLLRQLRELNLARNGLVGSVPHSMANLSNLRYLDLEENHLVSNDLEWLSHLSNLRILYLSSVNLSRAIDWPSSISKIPYLLVLFLDACGLPQVNPKSIPLMNSSTSLNSLSLRENQLNSSILSWLLNVSKVLTCLDLSSNSLHRVPNGFANMTSLQYLDLSHNELDGSLIKSLQTLCQLEDLKGLALNQNPFSSGPLPDFSRLSYLSLKKLSLRNTHIVGPLSFDHFSHLESLDLSFNYLNGSLPIFKATKLASLQVLDLSYNQLSGTIPYTLGQLSNMNVWDFSFNNLSGPLPPFPKKLYALFLSNNMLSGSVSSFCAMPPMDLVYLDLSSNLLAGSLENCWEKFQSLKVLNLANNNLSGNIPKSFGTLLQIESMHLNKNNFSGEIPSLTLWSRLRFIDFGDNILKGTLATWVGHNLHHLIDLRLGANKIQGSIPTSLCNLPLLQVLDLSANNITGEIPQCLGHIPALSNMKFPKKTIFYDIYEGWIYLDSQLNSFVDKTMLAWKGEIREYGKNLGLMTIIDLSDNHLTGVIPQSITTLSALVALNLSRNNLTGFIPNNIGHMKMLESLDMSRNHLNGRMPTSFSNLSFLSYMNLSFNNLSGKIPESTQLQSFDASTYVGNIGLCGPPLINQCPHDMVPPTRRDDKNGTDEDEDEHINFGFYISLVLGFCVGFWGVCGTLIIKSSWRHAYFQFFNNINDRIYVTVVVFMARVKRRIQIQD